MYILLGLLVHGNVVISVPDSGTQLYEAPDKQPTRDYDLREEIQSAMQRLKFSLRTCLPGAPPRQFLKDVIDV